MGAYDKVKLARGNKRPTGSDYIHNLFTGFLELHGDRSYADDAAIMGGIAWLADQPVTVIAIEKGHSAQERMKRSFGAPNPEGYRKALRLMHQAEKFHRPVICLIDTSGAYCGVGAEERGQGQAIAENLMEMMTLKTPVISVLVGEGGSGGALALAVADRVWMLENAIYSVISPEGCASILWKDAGKAAEAAEQLKLTAQDSLENGLIERVISEEKLGSDSFYLQLKQDLIEQLAQLQQEPEAQLLEERYQRFRRIGRECRPEFSTAENTDEEAPEQPAPSVPEPAASAAEPNRNREIPAQPPLFTEAEPAAAPASEVLATGLTADIDPAQTTDRNAVPESPSEPARTAAVEDVP